MIIVDLKMGAYYSIGGGGTSIWNYLSTGLTVDQTVDALSLAHSNDKSEISNSVHELLKTLLHDELLVESNDGEPLQPDSAHSKTSERLPMEPVVLEKFSDLSNALIYDPIHDFDQTTGWPNLQEHPASAPQREAVETASL
jgi:Coenzyme PQQ synthesis protein D (PqqD)